MASKEIDRQLLLDYLQGNCSIAQLRQLKEYLEDDAYRESLDTFLQEEWDAVNSSRQPELTGIDIQYEKFLAMQPGGKPISAPLPGLQQDRQVAGGRGRIRRLVFFAAAAALFFLVALVWLLRPGQPHPGPDGPWTVFHNGPGRAKKIDLPDGSLLYLASASTVKYNAGYNGANRTILLEGEAYFIVKHDGHQPFTVVTGDIATVDIGTEFNIRHYPGKPSIEVAVAKGRVEVRSRKGNAGDRIAAVTQGQSLSYNIPTAGSTLSRLSDTASIGAWRNGILSFRRQPLKEVTDQLERYYGIRVRYANPADGDIVLTTLLDNTTLEDALGIITVTAGLRYTRNGNDILLEDASGYPPRK